VRSGLKVRITETPRESEVDGVRLDTLTRGSVREVSSSIGAWLIAEGYAAPEMRRDAQKDELEFSGGVKNVQHVAHDRRHRRRSTDR
jgi:hypothetical protein